MVGEAGEADVADLDEVAGGDEDVCGFEVTVDDMRVVEVEEAVEELAGE